MKDRLAGAPGKYSAVVTGGEYQKLQSGQPFAITLARDDEPIIEGTPYSKATVLPDALAQQLCPDLEDPSPADAFAALNRNKAPAIESTEHPGCYYRIVNGATEWINPPMLLGVEYRTTERSEGKAVYAKRISYTTTETIGSATGVADTLILHQIDNFDYAVRCDGRFGVYRLPVLNATGGSGSIIQVTSGAIALRFYKETFSPTTFYFDLYYTKTT